MSRVPDRRMQEANRVSRAIMDLSNTLAIVAGKALRARVTLAEFTDVVRDCRAKNDDIRRELDALYQGLEDD